MGFYIQAVPFLLFIEVRARRARVLRAVCRVLCGAPAHHANRTPLFETHARTPTQKNKPTPKVRRKDFAESLAHHVVTLALLYYSFYANFVRPGLIIMLLHDVSDIFLEAAKLARYAGRQVWVGCAGVC